MKVTRMMYGEKVIEWTNKRGDPHRIWGPARIWPNGSKQWWRNGTLHRRFGPAIIDIDRGKDVGLDTGLHMEWWVDGEWVKSK
jgi:hypothetical protein